MRVCVFGASAIGRHLAARLAANGHAVSVVARGVQLRAIRAEGLTVRSPAETLNARPNATDDPAELGAQDAVLVTAKTPALPAIAPALAPLLGPARRSPS
jgi:2-dehydropantoate 2-reductase